MGFFTSQQMIRTRNTKFNFHLKNISWSCSTICQKHETTITPCNRTLWWTNFGDTSLNSASPFYTTGTSDQSPSTQNFPENSQHPDWLSEAKHAEQQEQRQWRPVTHLQQTPLVHAPSAPTETVSDTQRIDLDRPRLRFANCPPGSTCSFPGCNFLHNNNPGRLTHHWIQQLDSVPIPGGYWTTHTTQVATPTDWEINARMPTALSYTKAVFIGWMII